MTTVLPAAMAGPTFIDNSHSGLFQGITAATTPDRHPVGICLHPGKGGGEGLTVGFVGELTKKLEERGAELLETGGLGVNFAGVLHFQGGQAVAGGR